VKSNSQARQNKIIYLPNVENRLPGVYQEEIAFLTIIYNMMVGTEHVLISML
jgi:hypothetical protein